MAMRTKEWQTLDNSAIVKMLREKFPDSVFEECGNTITRIPKCDKRQACLDHYAQCEPMEFAQFDGWDIGADDPGDEIMRPDQDGHVLCSGQTWELRRSPEDLRVRVLIPIDTDPKAALSLMRKLTDAMESIAESGTPNFRPDSNESPF